jgi:hypothetical protein
MGCILVKGREMKGDFIVGEGCILVKGKGRRFYSGRSPYKKPQDSLGLVVVAILIQLIDIPEELSSPPFRKKMLCVSKSSY